MGENSTKTFRASLVKFGQNPSHPKILPALHLCVQGPSFRGTPTLEQGGNKIFFLPVFCDKK